MIVIDNLTLEFVSCTPNHSDYIKDFEMQNGDITRYTRRKNVVSLSCKGLINKSELNSLLSVLNSNTEHTVSYQFNGVQTAYMLADNFSYNKIVISESIEYWEVSFTLKESRRDSS